MVLSFRLYRMFGKFEPGSILIPSDAKTSCSDQISPALSIDANMIHVHLKP